MCDRELWRQNPQKLSKYTQNLQQIPSFKSKKLFFNLKNNCEKESALKRPQYDEDAKEFYHFWNAHQTITRGLEVI